jgi:hypothetical protein
MLQVQLGKRSHETSWSTVALSVKKGQLVKTNTWSINKQKCRMQQNFVYYRMKNQVFVVTRRKSTVNNKPTGAETLQKSSSSTYIHTDFNEMAKNRTIIHTAFQCRIRKNSLYKNTDRTHIEELSFQQHRNISQPHADHQAKSCSFQVQRSEVKQNNHKHKITTENENHIFQDT